MPSYIGSILALPVHDFLPTRAKNYCFRANLQCRIFAMHGGAQGEINALHQLSILREKAIFLFQGPQGLSSDRNHSFLWMSWLN